MPIKALANLSIVCTRETLNSEIMESTKRAALLYVEEDAEMTKEDAEPLSLLIESFYASGNLDPMFLDNIVKKLT